MEISVKELRSLKTAGMGIIKQAEKLLPKLEGAKAAKLATAVDTLKGKVNTIAEMLEQAQPYPTSATVAMSISIRKDPINKDPINKDPIKPLK